MSNEKLEELCKLYTQLNEKDIKQIQSLANNLYQFCDLAQADLFIDCMTTNDDYAIVVKHGRPLSDSLYSENIQGQLVEQKNEPIVFEALKTGEILRDATARSQEGKWVIQNTVPQKNAKGEIIAVLIEERDITEAIMNRQKLQQLKTKYNEPGICNIGNTNTEEFVNKDEMIQETHHRIKNNLQMISSILSMQSRRCQTEEAINVIKDNMNRINCIANVHEILMSTPGNNVDLLGQLQLLANNLMDYANFEKKSIEINVIGPKVELDSKKLTIILIIVNELITNSIKHAYVEQNNGAITITIKKGELFMEITVEDNGKGYDLKKCYHSKKGLGTELIEIMITGELKGSIKRKSGSNGTKVSFDFPI